MSVNRIATVGVKRVAGSGNINNTISELFSVTLPGTTGEIGYGTVPYSANVIENSVFLSRVNNPHFIGNLSGAGNGLTATRITGNLFDADGYFGSDWGESYVPNDDGPIIQNVVIGNGVNLISTPYSASTKARVKHNTIYDAYSINVGETNSSTEQLIEYTSNLMVSMRNGIGLKQHSMFASQTNFTLDYNASYNMSTASNLDYPAGHSYAGQNSYLGATSIAEWWNPAQTFGTDNATHDIIADPRFADPDWTVRGYFGADSVQDVGKEIVTVNGFDYQGNPTTPTTKTAATTLASAAQAFSPGDESGIIDAGDPSSGITEDAINHPIYGPPDIGAYEYQPPYEMGTNEIDIAANVRVYGDGKFRNTETPSGTTANLSIIPQSSQTTKWLDISKADDEEEIIWETNHKKWKESSTTLENTNTLHTIGDLTAGKSYTFTIDGNPASEDSITGNITSSDCINSICTANGTGKITFTYTGGYSEHEFEITEEEDEEDLEDNNDEEENNEENISENSENQKDLNTKKIKATSTENSITITWKTDKKTKSTIRYGTNKQMKEKKRDNDKEKDHKVTLTNLLPDTKYYFQIKSEDEDDEDKSKVYSIKTKKLANRERIKANENEENEKATDSGPSAQTSPNVCSYTIQQGDTLWNIAKKVYGDATKYSLINEKNKEKYPNIENRLNIGLELVFCDNNLQSETRNSQPETNNSQPEINPPTKKSKWWNPFSWF